MNTRIKMYYAELARLCGLLFDEANMAIHGELKGCPVLLYPESRNYPYRLTVLFSVNQNAAPFDKAICKELRRAVKGLGPAFATDTSIRTMLTAKEAPQAAGTLEAAAEYLSQHGAVSVCQHCGAEKSVDAANMGGAYMLLCDECYASVRRMIELNQNLRNTQKENFWGGIAGASGGALLGAFCIFLIAQLGYIAAVSGAVLSICTLAGYKKLGRRLTKKKRYCCLHVADVSDAIFFIPSQYQFSVDRISRYNVHTSSLGAERHSYIERKYDVLLGRSGNAVSVHCSRCNSRCFLYYA